MFLWPGIAGQGEGDFESMLINLFSPVSELWFSDRPSLKRYSVLSFTEAHSCILTCIPCSRRENTTKNKKSKQEQQKNKKQEAARFWVCWTPWMSTEKLVTLAQQWRNGPVLRRAPICSDSLPNLTLQADAPGRSLNVKDNRVHEQYIEKRPGTKDHRWLRQSNQ